MVGSETRSTKALGLIRAELSDLKKRRVSALALYLGLVLGFLGLLFFSPGKSPPKNIDVFWLSSLAVLFFSSAIAGAATIGLPLLRRNATYVLTAGAGLGLIGALALVAQWDASRLETGQGAHCFLYCAAVSSAAMVVLGILSGRLWRRVSQPGTHLGHRRHRRRNGWAPYSLCCPRPPALVWFPSRAPCRPLRGGSPVYQDPRSGRTGVNTSAHRRGEQERFVGSALWVLTSKGPADHLVEQSRPDVSVPLIGGIL